MLCKSYHKKERPEKKNLWGVFAGWKEAEIPKRESLTLVVYYKSLR